EQVEADERRRGLGREPLDAALGRVNALRERLPGQALGSGFAAAHHDLAVDDGAGGELRGELGDQLGKVARQWLRPAAADLDAVRGDGDDGAEAVPLGFERDTPAV